MSEAALARCRAHVGLEVQSDRGAWEPAPPWTRTLGTLVDADRLTDPHALHDQLAFARAVGPLRAARDAIGRDETAEILDRLVTALGWRAVYAAGPGGRDDVAQLEVLLDRVRTLSADGLDPHGILTALGVEDADEAPQVHLDRPDRYVACTTVFQAKGRAWDHVMVWSAGRPPRLAATTETPTTWIRLPGHPDAVRLAGLRFDPSGGMSPFKEPLGRLAARLEERRFDEECVRLAYVAITRARRTVTLGLPDADSYCGRVQWLLARTWRELPDQEGLTAVEVPAPDAADTLPPGQVLPVEGARFELPVAEGPVWHEQAPSAAAAQLSPEERKQHADWIAHRVRLTNGLWIGADPVDPPEHLDLHATTWGELAHGWFARWRFSDEPSPEEAAAWLREAWRVDDPFVVDWLIGISRQVARTGGPLWERVRDPKARLHFELPFVGVGRAGGLDLLLSGRIDLLVELGRRLVVVDFKAGGRHPTGHADLIDGASLRTYGPQLEAYRTALERMGREVEAVALWFVRTGTSVHW